MLAALMVSTVWLAATDRPQNSAMEEYREEYEWYLERLRELEAENRALRKKLEEKDEVIDVLKKSVGILSKP